MKEHYVSYDCAKRLHELGFDGVDKYYVTENFCSGNNPISFDTFSVGDLVDEHIVYFVNDNNEDDYRGIPAPRLDQAAAWLRSKGYSVEPFTEAIEPEDKEYTYQIEVKTEKPYTKFSEHNFDTYEEALSDGISKALELLGKEDKQ